MNYKYLHIDNLLYNLNKFEGKKICAMVKSDAYGHGLKEIVEQAQSKVDYFGVVNVEEGKLVRKLCDKPILICSKVDDLKSCKCYGLEVMVENEEDVKRCLEIGIRDSMHLKIDCGMNRFGCDSELCLRVLNGLLLEKDIKLKSIYTHFPRTESAHSTKKSYKKFLQLKSEITQNPITCFGGSGIYGYKFDYDMLRLGIGMYGYGDKLLPVMEIWSSVCKIFYAKKGEYIGYGKKYKVSQDGYFAVVNMGYGDGLRRNLSGRFSVKINNRLFEAVGNICMDAFFIKVDGSVNVGDKVCVMWDADEMAKKSGTIVYEILTGFSNLRGKTVLKND